jgi:hypothetical protein
MPDKLKTTKSKLKPKDVKTRPPDDIETPNATIPDVKTKPPEDVETTTKA